MSTPPGPEHVRVAIVDDHAVVTRGLTADLAPQEGIEVVAVGRTVAELLALAVPVDVVVLDVDLHDGSRPGDNVRSVHGAGARVLLFSAYEDGAMLMQAARAGAEGYLNKSRELDDVATAIREIAAGEQVVSAELLLALASASDVRPDLSARQEEVLVRYTSTDAKLPTVARQLGMGAETLKTHLRRIKDKYAELDRPVSSRLELYRRAVEDGYLPDDHRRAGA